MGAAQIDEMAAKNVILQDVDGKHYPVPLAVALMSETVKTLLPDEPEDVDSDYPIPLPAVKGEHLVKIIEWCTHEVENEDLKPHVYRHGKAGLGPPCSQRSQRVTGMGKTVVLNT